MTKGSVPILLVSLLGWICLGMAQEKKIVSVPIPPTSPASAQQMYTEYCAVCHGVDGRGNGPAASALKQPIPDLTTMAQRHGGTYPWAHVNSVLTFGTSEMVAHGSPEMPVWGSLFGSLNTNPHSQEARLRIANLNNYLKAMQMH